MKYKEIKNIIKFYELFAVEITNPFTNRKKAYFLCNPIEKHQEIINNAEVLKISNMSTGYKKTSPVIFLDIPKEMFLEPKYKNEQCIYFRGDLK